jgi:Ca2+-transporting ATPase
MSNSWHRHDIETTLSHFGTTRNGLTEAAAKERLITYGPNEMEEKKKKSVLVMFLEQFKDLMILILLAAAIIAGLIGDLTDTLVIMAIVVANAIIGFIQEYRAEGAMAALKAMTAPIATAIRGGAPSRIPAAEIVPGDMVLLEAGVIVPADIRLVESLQLKAEEAALTGESLPVEKETRALTDSDLPLGDRCNMVFKGTVISYGRGSGVVVATGMKTELGKIAAMLQEEEEGTTPLQKRLAAFSKKLVVIVLTICAMIFGIGLLRGEAPLFMLLMAISLAVAAIPEALPAVITISLALGAKIMVKKNALVRKLPAVETLGSVTYICSDKTGTLTLNKMTVEEIYAKGDTYFPGDPEIKNALPLFQALALSNDAREENGGALIGDPTETALFSAAKRHGFFRNDLEKQLPRIDEIPFDSERKSMTTIHRTTEGRYVSFTKGAIDILIEKTDSVWADEGPHPIEREKILAVNNNMASRGLRVLYFAMREFDTLPEIIAPDTVETGLTFLGLAGLMDPPREEVIEAVGQCKSAGIHTVMITGDHPVTARAIALRIGMIEQDAGDNVISGIQLEKLSPAEFEKNVEGIRVYARVSPEQKLKIVKALQDKGQFVAMTGDGVNDAPALKRADIGVAMGITGTDVSKEAAHMILLDDNFATIVNAVKEGRKIYDNIRKLIRYLLTTNSGEIWTLFLAQLAGLPVPILPIHILWVNLITDGLPALALSTEPAEGDVMKRPPRHPKESIFAHGLGVHALLVGLFMAMLVLGIQTWGMRSNIVEWQTMVFTALCFTQLYHVMAIRSERESFFTQGLFSNPYLLVAVAISFILQMAIIYVPALNLIFKTQPLSAFQLFLCIAVSSLIFFAVEMEKCVRRFRQLR